MGTLRRVRKLDMNGTDGTTMDNAPRRARDESETEAVAEQQTARLPELPLVPGMATALRREAQRRWRKLGIIALVAGGVCLFITIASSVGGDSTSAWRVLPFVFIFTLCVGGGGWSMRAGRLSPTRAPGGSCTRPG